MKPHLLALMFFSAGVCGAPQAGRADGDTLFANVERWAVIRHANLCLAATRAGDDELLFSLRPRPAIIIENGRFNIAPGTYPIGMSFLDPDTSLHQERTVQATVSAERRDAVIIRFQDAADMSRLLSQGWLSFNLGGHMHFFNTSAASAIRMISVCEHGGASDPFATAR